MLRGAAAGGALCLCWFVGLAWFATPPAPETGSRPTDAIVVLTGGSLRVESGIDLLREGKGRVLFVSGVDRRVGLDALLRASGRAPAHPQCCIVLGYDAEDTRTNAAEAARWMRRQGYDSLRLVTAWYHMPRSLLEFERAMPDIAIVAHPVFPDEARLHRWWARDRTTLLLIGEYDKYLATLIRSLVEYPLPALAAAPVEAEMRRDGLR
jgi:uncharacterized SAM-binding protein YcdF (DUF218 family)